MYFFLYKNIKIETLAQSNKNWNQIENKYTKIR